MRRKSERNKSKSTPEKSPDKPSRKSHRHSRRRRKSSSSSSDDERGARSTSRVKTDSTSDKTKSRSVSPDIKTNLSDIPEPPAKPEPVPNVAVVKNNTDSKNESGVVDDAKSKDTPGGGVEWKEDNSFWQTDEKNDDHSSAAVPTTSASGEEKAKDSKDAGEVWKVQSANGSTGKGGEIQKLKICRQRLAESPELPKDTPPRRRLSRTPKDSSGSNKNEGDEDAVEEGKHPERETSSSSSPSPPVHEALNVICETESPTKIKIINVGSLTPDKRSYTPPIISPVETPVVSKEQQKPIDSQKPTQEKGEDEEKTNEMEETKTTDETKTEKSESPEESKGGEEIAVTEDLKTTDNTVSESLQETEQKVENDNKNSKSKEGSVEKSPPLLPEKSKQESSVSTGPKKGESNESIGMDKKDKSKSVLINNEKEKQIQRSSSSKSPNHEKEERRSVKKSSFPSPRHERKRSSSSSSSSSDDSSSSSDSDSSHSRKKSSKSKRRDNKKSAASTKHPKKAASDSEDDRRHQKEKASSSWEGHLDRTHSVNSNKENLVTNSKPASAGDSGGMGTPDQGAAVVTRKRRWGASKTIRPVKKPVLSISTDSLKNLIPGAKPVPAEELQLSVEEEEGQLDDDDDDDEIIEVAQQAEKDSVRKKEREHEKDERRKERKEKDLEERRKKYSDRKDIKPEKPSTSGSDNMKGSSTRKILLITDDARKLAHSPSPPRRRPSNVLFITNLVRPFTAQQLKNLLLRTGTIAENGFWIDKIKSKCYVEYTTEDAAVETRHALHGVRWPVNNPKTLVVEFASHDDMAVAQALSEETDPIPRKAEPLMIDRSVEGWIADQARLKAQGDRSNRRVMAAIREWDVGKPEHPDEIIELEHRGRERQREQERRMLRKERPHRSMTPDISELPARKQRRKEDDAPVKLLDDLFKKTKTSPCIYWLPLTVEQIAVKEEMRRQHMAEHERRVAEMKKAEQARRERDRRNRK